MPAPMLIYFGLILFTAAERLVELRVSLRNAAWSFARGGREFGRGHYPVMVILHTGFLIACPLEVWLLERPFVPLIGYPLLAAAVALQGLRWWCIRSLGPHWNTRVIVVPDTEIVRRGPYRWVRHPNYVVVVIEGLVLPLVHSAWSTALVFSLANAALLRRRLAVENLALQQITPDVARSTP